MQATIQNYKVTLTSLFTNDKAKSTILVPKMHTYLIHSYNTVHVDTITQEIKTFLFKFD